MADGKMNYERARVRHEMQDEMRAAREMRTNREEYRTMMFMAGAVIISGNTVLAATAISEAEELFVEAEKAAMRRFPDPEPEGDGDP